MSTDTSTIPIDRVENLEDTIEDINTSIDTNVSELNDKIKELTQTITDLEASFNTKLTEMQSSLVTSFDNKLRNKDWVIQYPNITTTGRITVSLNTDYTLTQNAWVWWGNTSYVGSRSFYINGVLFARSYGSSGNWEEFNSMFLPLKKGVVIKHTGSNSICYVYTQQ